MIIYKKVQKTVDALDAIKCDVCDRTFHAKNDDDLELQEFVQIRFTGGYESVFEDGTMVECDICQYCFKEKLGTYCRTKEEQ